MLRAPLLLELSGFGEALRRAPPPLPPPHLLLPALFGRRWRPPRLPLQEMCLAVLRGAAARETAARAAVAFQRSTPRPGKTLLRVFPDPHVQHIDAAALVEVGTSAAFLMDDRTSFLVEDNAVATCG